MAALAEHLIEHVQPDGDHEEGPWAQVVGSMKGGDGLEEALQKNAVPPTLSEKVVASTWRAIATDDAALLQRAATGRVQFPLSELIGGLFQSTNNTINIITPNYDRVAEFAVDLTDFIHLTGFVPGIISRREGAAAISVREGSRPARVVRIWKVHGSLDWFVDSQGVVVSLPVSGEVPEGLLPLIVTPGVSKYERTHEEPFRSTIQGADAVLDASTGFLCVGYGFRDSHIQPKLVEKCRQRNVPIVVLARSLTDEAKRFLSESAGTSYMAVEADGERSRVFTAECPNGVTLDEAGLWSLDGFNKLAF